MLERLVQPILEVFVNLEEVDNKITELAKKKEQLQKDYEKEMKPLDKKLNEYKDEAHALREKQVTLRKELGRKLAKSNVSMTTVQIGGKTYGVYDYSGMAMISELTDTKIAETLITVVKLEKSMQEGK